MSRGAVWGGEGEGGVEVGRGEAPLLGRVFSRIQRGPAGLFILLRLRRGWYLVNYLDITGRYVLVILTAGSPQSNAVWGRAGAAGLACVVARRLGSPVGTVRSFDANLRQRHTRSR